MMDAQGADAGPVTTTRGVVLQGVDRPERFAELVRRFDATMSTLWLTDSSLHARNPYAYLTLAAMNSQQLLLGTAVTNPVTRHPAITAAAAATVDEISNGRMLLGIGAGDRPLVALAERPATLRTLEDSIDVIRRLIAGETVDHAGSFGLHDAHLRFATAGHAIPVFVSATGPRTLEMSGRVAEGVILLCGLVPETVQWALDHIDRGARAAGRPRPHVAVFAYGVIDEDEARAVEQARSIAAWFPQTAPNYCELAGLDPQIAAAVRERYRGGEFQEAGEAAALLPVEFVQKMALAGNRERTTALLAGLVTMGVDSINVFPLGDDRLATVEAFGECCDAAGIS
jgi:5,10-methylenetetrahydromethanopterin reductase